MLGGPSEKKYFFSRSPPSNPSPWHPELIVKSTVKRMNKAFFMAHMSMNCNRNLHSRPALKWDMIMSHLAQLFSFFGKSPKRPHNYLVSRPARPTHSRPLRRAKRRRSEGILISSAAALCFNGFANSLCCEVSCWDRFRLLPRFLVFLLLLQIFLPGGLAHRWPLPRLAHPDVPLFVHIAGGDKQSEIGAKGCTEIKPKPNWHHTQTYLKSSPTLLEIMPKPTWNHAQTYLKSCPNLLEIMPRPTWHHAQTYLKSCPNHAQT